MKEKDQQIAIKAIVDVKILDILDKEIIFLQSSCLIYLFQIHGFFCKLKNTSHVLENASDICASNLTHIIWSMVFRKSEQQTGFHVKLVVFL